MKSHWTESAVFYHIYPLGLCGAPDKNSLDESVVHRLNVVYPWLDHIQSMGFNALYLGPLFQSSSHGYDTIDYYQVDRRLGDNTTLTCLADEIHRRGMRFILDGVFNHVGRDFWAFKDVQAKGENSEYCDWFHGLRFGCQNSLGDPFQYEGWHGHISLVKLNLSNSYVREHLFNAVSLWIDLFNIDGLRLDAADCMDLDFLRELKCFTQAQKNDFWLMGEVVHGNYRDWVNPETLDSVTNYTAYKGLYSSLSEQNYFEAAHCLNQQFSATGIYTGLRLYNFVDNHDVDRVASKFTDLSLLYPLYLLLFTMPGIPSVYNGSEWGITGTKTQGSDAPLRPALDLTLIREIAPQPQLEGWITKLSSIRQSSDALMFGGYLSLFIGHQQFAFIRQTDENAVIVALNSASQESLLELDLNLKDGNLNDLLDPSCVFQVKEGQTKLTIPPAGGRILRFS